MDAPISRTVYNTHNKVLPGQVDTLYSTCDVHCALVPLCLLGLLCLGGIGVREVYLCSCTLHYLLDVCSTAPYDEQVMLGRYLQLHAYWHCRL